MNEREDRLKQLRWLEHMERIEQEVFPDARPRSEVIVPCTCVFPVELDPGIDIVRREDCPIHGVPATPTEGES